MSDTLRLTWGISPSAMNTTLRGVVYVSAWVVLWGTAASLADTVLLQRGTYGPGTAGQAVTFSGGGRLQGR